MIIVPSWQYVLTVIFSRHFPYQSVYLFRFLRFPTIYNLHVTCIPSVIILKVMSQQSGAQRDRLRNELMRHCLTNDFVLFDEDIIINISLE